MSSNNPGSPKLWARLTIAGCAVALIADLILWATGHWHGKLFPGLYAVIGFVSYCVIVYGAMAWRKVVMRAEDYYEDVPELYVSPDRRPRESGGPVATAKPLDSRLRGNDDDGTEEQT